MDLLLIQVRLLLLLLLLLLLFVVFFFYLKVSQPSTVAGIIL